MRVTWDVMPCASGDCNLIYGNLSEVSSYALLDGPCSIGSSGEYVWLDSPLDDPYSAPTL